MPLPWSEAGPGSKPAPFPPSVHILVGSGSLCLSGDQCWSKRGWSRCLVQAGGHTGMVPRHFSISCLFAVTGSKQICACALQEWSLSFLQPLLVNPTGFQASQGGLSSPCQTQGLRCLIYGSHPSFPREAPLACDSPLLLCVPHQRCGS